MIVKNIMTKNPIALTPNDKLKKVLHVLAENEISGCPVVSRDKRVLGVITQTDILKLIDVHSKIQRSGTDLFSLVLAAIRSEHYDDLKKTIKKVLELSIKDFMEKKVVTIDNNEDIYTAAKLMNKHDIDRLPVTENDKLVGIVTRWDLIRALEKIG